MITATATIAAFLIPALQEVAESAPAASAPRGPAHVFRVDRLETLDGDPLRNATLVVRDGRIEKLGEAVVLPEGARVHDWRGGTSTAMPPLVLGHANFLNRDARGSGRNSRFRAADSLHLDERDLSRLLAQGVLLLGVDPPGSGLPGRSSVYASTATGERPEALVNDLHLKLTVSTDPAALELLRKAIQDAEEAIEKEKKAKEEWEKARKEWEAKQKAKQEAEQKAKEQQQQQQQQPPPQQQAAQQQQPQAEEKAPPEKFEPPPIDPDLKPVVEWLRRQRPVQVWLGSASDWLHWLDVLGKRELPYELVLSHGDSQNFSEVAADIAGRKLRVEVPARISFLPNTRIRANLPAELSRAGARLVLAPPQAGSGFGRGQRGGGGGGGGGGEVDPDEIARSWRVGAADLVREGLERAAALRAMTLEPAAALGQEEQVAPLKAGGPATFVVFDGDPLDPTARVRYVVVAGEIRFDRSRERLP